MPDESIAPHPDRLLPADPGVRALVRRLLDPRPARPLAADRRGHVAGLVAEHRLEDDEAYEIHHDLVVTNLRKAFRL
jgi:glucuronate isomerase